MSNRVIHNIGEIEAIMENLAREIIEIVAEQVLKDFQNDYIAKVMKPQPNFYRANRNRSPSFISSWEWTKLKKDATSISKTMFYNYEKTKSSPHYFDRLNPPYKGFGIHGSEHPSSNDVREFMPDIMNQEHVSDAPVTFDRPFAYWTQFIIQYVEGGKLKQLVDRTAKSKGLVLK